MNFSHIFKGTKNWNENSTVARLSEWFPLCNVSFTLLLNLYTSHGDFCCLHDKLFSCNCGMASPDWKSEMCLNIVLLCMQHCSVQSDHRTIFTEVHFIEIDTVHINQITSPQSFQPHWMFTLLIKEHTSKINHLGLFPPALFSYNTDLLL